jgi:hypothetical protein
LHAGAVMKSKTAAARRGVPVGPGHAGVPVAGRPWHYLRRVLQVYTSC